VSNSSLKTPKRRYRAPETAALTEALNRHFFAFIKTNKQRRVTTLRTQKLQNRSPETLANTGFKAAVMLLKLQSPMFIFKTTKQAELPPVLFNDA